MNAIKFTPRGGRVTVSARTELAENVAVLVISDTGVGMDPEDIVRVMAPGWAGLRTTPGVHGDPGSGMGLAAARRQVELLGGTLELRSCKGFGTCAIISLPRARSAAARRQAGHQRRRGRRGHTARAFARTA